MVLHHITQLNGQLELRAKGKQTFEQDYDIHGTLKGFSVT